MRCVIWTDALWRFPLYRRKEMSEQGELRIKTIPLLVSESGKAIVRQVCGDGNLSESVFWKLVDAEMEQIGKQRKRGLHELFDDAFDHPGE